MIKKLLVLLPLVILSACGGGDDGGSSSTSGNAGASGLVGAFNAPTIGANCVLTDSDNTIITSQVTDSDGMISFENVPVPTGIVSLTCTGGQYTDEATGLLINPAPTLHAATNYTGGTLNLISTPLSEIAYQRALSDSDLSDIIAQNNAVATAFGLQDIDIASTIPTNLNEAAAENDAAGQLGLVLAAVSQLGFDNNASPEEIITSLLNDLNDSDNNGIEDELSAVNHNIANAIDALQVSVENAPASAFAQNSTAAEVAVNTQLIENSQIALRKAETNNVQPVARAQTLSVDKNRSKEITLIGTDADKDEISFTIMDGATHGRLVGKAPNIIYTPDVDYVGNDSFTFKVNDRFEDSEIETVSITVVATNIVKIATGNNITPQAFSQSINANEDRVKSITLRGADSDADNLNFIIVEGPENGSINGAAPNLTYLPFADYNGSDSFTFKVNDGLDDSETATVSITITGRNDVPKGISQDLNTNENTPISFTLSGTDVDSSDLVFTLLESPTHGILEGTIPNFTYTPAANYNGADSLVFNVNDGITVSTKTTILLTVNSVNNEPVAEKDSFTLMEDESLSNTVARNDAPSGDGTDSWVVTEEASHGVVTLSRNGSFVYTPEQNYNGTDHFSYSLSDSDMDVSTASVSLNIEPVNDRPEVRGQELTVAEDNNLTIILSGTDIDDGDNLTFSHENPSNGTLTGSGEDLTYRANQNFNGNDSFTFTAYDSEGESSTATIEITITPVNDTPIAVSQTVIGDKNTATSITLEASDVDTNTSVSYIIMSDVSHGSLSGISPDLRYNPSSNYFGSDSFTFKANDGTVDSETVTVNITINEINPNLTAVAQSVTTDEDITKSITLEGSDNGGGTVNFVIVSEPEHGELSGTVPNLSYTPEENYNGSDSFTFYVSDDFTNSATVTVDIAIAAINDGPEITSTPVLIVNEDEQYSYTFEATDVDGDVLTYSVVGTLPSWLSFDTDTDSGLLTGIPNNTNVGVHLVTLQVTDGSGASRNSNFNITVSNINDAPTATSQSLTVAEDDSLMITLAGTDIDGDSLTFSYESPSSGVLTGTAPNLTYSPNENFNGSDSFTFTANDGTVDSSVATININITPVNDEPVITSTPSTEVDEGGVYSYTLLAEDGDGDALTYSVAGSLPGWLNFNTATGQLTGTPNNADVGSHDILLQVTDGNTAHVDDSFRIIVANTNDEPTATSQSLTVTEDDSLMITLAGTDIDGDSLTFSYESPSSGVLTGTAPNLTYSPNENFNGSDSFTFTANDGTVDSLVATININITPVNDMPVITSTPSTEVDEDGVYSYPFAASDIDGDTVVLSIIEPQPSWLTFDSDSGVLTGTPDNSQVGSYQVTLQASDNMGGTVTEIFTINVINTNDAPTIDSTATTSVDEDAEYSYTPTATDIDVGDTLSYSIIDMDPPGWISLDTVTGTLSGAPLNEDVGEYDVTLQVSDMSEAIVIQIVTIIVNNTNDEPVITSSEVTTVNEDEVYNYTFVATDVDVGDTVTLSAPTKPSWLIFDDSTGVLTGTPLKGDVGEHSVGLRATDTSNSFDEQTFSITVSNTNDAPEFTSTPVTDLNVDEIYTYNITAIDVDAEASVTLSAHEAPYVIPWLTFTATSGNPATGTLTGTPTSANIGNHNIRLRVTDDLGVGIDQFIVFTVLAPATPLTVSISDASMDEGDESTTDLEFTVTISDVETSNVDYIATDLTATDESDYTAASGTLTFEGGETSQTISIGIFGDHRAEINETFTITLSNPSANLTIADGIAIGTIINDDLVLFNDTGLTFGGTAMPPQNNADCTGATIAAQDCSHGRDSDALAGTLDKEGGGSAGFDFTKLTSVGQPLTDQGQEWDDEGSEAEYTQWSCVQDNVTGFIWEVKTNNEESHHFKDNEYTWGGLTAIGADYSGAVDSGIYYNTAYYVGEGESDESWDPLINASNGSLCGFSGWKVPSANELMTIVHFGNSDEGEENPYFDKSYFPNANSSGEIWTASPYAEDATEAWEMNLSNAQLDNDERDEVKTVRLVIVPIPIPDGGEPLG